MSPTQGEVPHAANVSSDRPFDGLFGDTAELRVLQEIVADPYSDYTHRDLMELTDLSDPSVRRGIRALVDRGIVINVSSARKNPLYRANLESKRLTALTLLSYATLDERTGGSSMDDAVKHYCDFIPNNTEAVPRYEGSNFVRYGHPSYERTVQDARSRTIIKEA
jgi:hypothetical protein